ncbi:MAG: dicarboxylate/amino acid:cation symporter [Rikenellaceae bacterium]
MRKRKVNLIWKILIAIALGTAIGFIMPTWGVRLFTTINSIFSNFLGFIIPLLILGLVAPGIAELGKTSGKMLGISTGIAYGSTVVTGFLTLIVCWWLYSFLLVGGSDFGSLNLGQESAFAPYFTIDMPALFGVTSALILAFVLGLGAAYSDSKYIKYTLVEFRAIIMKIITAIIIPFLPIYIFGVFLKMVADGQIMIVSTLFLKVIIIVFVLHILLIVLQYSIAGWIAKRNPFKMLRTMLPAYVTALGTQSSAATIPVTLENTLKNGVEEDVADFVIPLCATIHLSASMLKIVACSMAIILMTGGEISWGLMTTFIFSLSVTMVAAPGVPGGAIMAALGLLSSVLGFDEGMSGIMIAIYITMDGFGTAGNIMGDGAIAIVVDKLKKM